MFFVSFRRYQHGLLAKSLVCLLKDRIELSWQDNLASRAVFWVSREEIRNEDIERFAKIFGEYGFIAGFNTMCFCGKKCASVVKICLDQSQDLRVYGQYSVG